jgi:hypothetical protein
MSDRATAVRTYNDCWRLLDLEERTPDQEAELLTAAFTSRFHWIEVGGDEQLTTADWMVSRAAAAVGDGALAVRFARRAIARAILSDLPAWLRASVHEGAARAYAVAGDADLRDSEISLAREWLGQEEDPENRAVIEEQLASVPRAG